MMVQGAPEGEAHFLCSMREHNDLCGQFVRTFGNDDFERCEPFEEMVYVVSHHDYGWDEFDAAPMLDEKTGLPRGIGGAPVPGNIDTGRLSAEVNEAKHLFCGLISSMHSWGLYHARYGFSQFSVRPGGSLSIPVGEKDRDEADAMLSGEIARQERAKKALAADPATADWVREERIVQNYKQLQFFDTLALYFNLRHPSNRGSETFVHVPKTASEDADVTVTPKGDEVYAFDPFPFAGDRVEFTCAGRYLEPFQDGKAPDDLSAALAALPNTSQTYTFVRG